MTEKSAAMETRMDTKTLSKTVLEVCTTIFVPRPIHRPDVAYYHRVVIRIFALNPKKLEPPSSLNQKWAHPNSPNPGHMTSRKLGRCKAKGAAIPSVAAAQDARPAQQPEAPRDAGPACRDACGAPRLPDEW